jgi:hypothetical protein
MESHEIPWSYMKFHLDSKELYIISAKKLINIKIIQNGKKLNN